MLVNASEPSGGHDALASDGLGMHHRFLNAAITCVSLTLPGSLRPARADLVPQTLDRATMALRIELASGGPGGRHPRLGHARVYVPLELRGVADFDYLPDQQTLLLDAELAMNPTGVTSGYLDARLWLPGPLSRIPGVGVVQRFEFGPSAVSRGSDESYVTLGPRGQLDMELSGLASAMPLGHRGRFTAVWGIQWRSSGTLAAVPTPSAGLLGLLGLTLVAGSRSLRGG